MPSTDERLIQGIYNLDNVQDHLRIYAQNREFFKFWAFRVKTPLSLLRVIAKKFGTVPGGDITDWVLKYPEFDEIKSTVFLQEDSNVTDASNTKFKINNEDAIILQSITRLHVNGVWCKSVVGDAANDMAVAMDVDNGIVIPETIRIQSVGQEDSGGAGLRVVTVKRAHPANSYTNTPPPITTAMKLTVSNIVVRADDYPKPPITKNSKMLENNVQITRWSYGLGEHMTQGGGIETYLAKGEGYLNIQYRLAEIFMMKAIERGIFTGRRSKKIVNGSYEYESGGILEFVNQFIDLKQERLTPERMNNYIRRIADLVGVNEVWLFTGTHLSEQIANAYEGKSIYHTNAKLSVEYMLNIKTLESVGRSLIVHHVTAPILNELGMANEGLALNLTEYNYNEKHKFGCFQVGHKVAFDDFPKDQKTYKAGDGYKGTWREFYGAWSLIRRLQDTHVRLVNAAPVKN